MAYTAVPTATTGDAISAAYWNTYLKDNFASSENGMFANKGDLLIATAANTAAVLPVGADGLGLTALAAEATGLKWAAPSQWELITKTKLAADTATVTFADIPQTYRHLRLLISGQTEFTGTVTTTGIHGLINGDTGANYDCVNPEYYNGAFTVWNIAAANSLYLLGYLRTNYGSSLQAGLIELLFLDYAGTTFQKYLQSTSLAASVFTEIFSLWWRSTNAITRLDLYPASSLKFLAGTVFTLYGM